MGLLGLAEVLAVGGVMLQEAQEVIARLRKNCLSPPEAEALSIQSSSNNSDALLAPKVRPLPRLPGVRRVRFNLSLCFTTPILHSTLRTQAHIICSPLRPRPPLLLPNERPSVPMYRMRESWRTGKSGSWPGS